MGDDGSNVSIPTLKKLYNSYFTQHNAWKLVIKNINMPYYFNDLSPDEQRLLKDKEKNMRETLLKKNIEFIRYFKKAIEYTGLDNNEYKNVLNLLERKIAEDDNETDEKLAENIDYFEVKTDGLTEFTNQLGESIEDNINTSDLIGIMNKNYSKSMVEYIKAVDELEQ